MRPINSARDAADVMSDVMSAVAIAKRRRCCEMDDPWSRGGRTAVQDLRWA